MIFSKKGVPEILFFFCVTTRYVFSSDNSPAKKERMPQIGKCSEKPNSCPFTLCCSPRGLLHELE